MLRQELQIFIKFHEINLIFNQVNKESPVFRDAENRKISQNLVRMRNITEFYGKNYYLGQK